MGPANVQRRQPGQPRFERRMHRRQAHERTIVGERTEQGRAIGDDRRAERHVAGDAVLAGAIRIPRWDVSYDDRHLHQATILDRVVDLDVLRPLDRGDQRDVARLQSAHVHGRGHTVTTVRSRPKTTSPPKRLGRLRHPLLLGAGRGRGHLVGEHERP